MCYSENQFNEPQKFIELRGLTKLGLSFSLVFGAQIMEYAQKFYLRRFQSNFKHFALQQPWEGLNPGISHLSALRAFHCQPLGCKEQHFLSHSRRKWDNQQLGSKPVFGETYIMHCVRGRGLCERQWRWFLQLKQHLLCIILSLFASSKMGEE